LDSGSEPLFREQGEMDKAGGEIQEKRGEAIQQSFVSERK
jgi:hypothetical protein